MAENTEIEWADHTFNPWEGCQKVGPGCDHCYAETRNARFGGGTAPNWGPGAPRRRTSASNWKKPRKWARAARAFHEKHGRRQRVFCASLADVFDNAVDPAWRRDLFDEIEATPELDWLILTKRIGNVQPMLKEMGIDHLPENVWLGATIVNQEEADRDIPKLIAIKATLRFLSMEPLLGEVCLTQINAGSSVMIDALNGDSYDELGERGKGVALDWIIVGGESGAGARPMHPDWVRSLRDQCTAARVPFLFKQWGEWKPLDTNDGGFWPHNSVGSIRLTMEGETTPDGWPMQKVGKHFAGRMLDGVVYDGFPIGHDFSQENDHEAR